MVSFTEIAKAIMDNSEKEFSVQSCIPKHESVVPVYKLERQTSETAIKNPFERIAVRIQIPKAALQPTPVLQPVTTSVLPIVDSESEPDLEPIPIIPKNTSSLPTQKESTIPNNVSSQQTSQKDSPVSKKPTLLSKSLYKKPQDPICIGLSTRDPMYEIASASVKQSMEVEEARILESKIADLYKSESGRSRGWTKKDLEAFFQVRSATGGSLPPKQVFVWASVFSDKHTSALLDFVCIAKNIRIAVWNKAEKCIGIWPAADLSTSKQTPSLYHVNTEGISLDKDTIFEEGWSLRAALSVEHGLEKLSIDELDSIAEKMGILERMNGKKIERVRILAQARTEQRLQIN